MPIATCSKRRRKPDKEREGVQESIRGLRNIIGEYAGDGLGNTEHMTEPQYQQMI